MVDPPKLEGGCVSRFRPRNKGYHSAKPVEVSLSGQLDLFHVDPGVAQDLFQGI